MSLKIHSPSTLVRGGITSAMADVVNGDRVILRVGAAAFGQIGVRGTRLQGNVKASQNVAGRVFELVELTEAQIDALEEEHNNADNQ